MRDRVVQHAAAELGFDMLGKIFEAEAHGVFSTLGSRGSMAANR
jgi:hypothetical protein